MRKRLGMIRHTAEWVKEFFHAKGASAAIIFGLTAVTLLSTAGASLDLARGMMVKSRLASALDAAGLAVGSTNGLSSDALNALANQYFNANYPATELGTHSAVTVTQNGQHMTLSVSGSMPTTLLHFMGIGTLDFTLTNEVTKAVTKLRVALVLDNTGSMSQTDVTGTSKISALKTATHQLLTQLQGAAVNPGDVQVSIIPFSVDVKYAAADPTANWIDWSDFDAAPPKSMPGINDGPGSSCPYSTNTSPYGYGCLYLSGGKIAADGKIYPGADSGNYNSGRGGHQYNGYWTSELIAGSCVTVTSKKGVKTTTCNYNHNWHTYNHAAKADLPLHGAWTGCFMDRTQSYDASNTAPSTGLPATLFPAEINSSCPPVTLAPLGYDWSALSTKVDQMTPNGSTNQTIGLAWGWQSLTSSNPLNAPTQDPTVQNVIVLLSDGMNTQDRWYGDGSTTNTNVDNRMAQACANAKAANVRVYTVLVMSGNSSVLQSCASDPQKYFSLGTAGEIVTAFNTIGTELANLHLSR